VTPLGLLVLVAVLAIVRVALGILPGTAVALGVEERGGAPSARKVVREYLDAFIVAGLVALFLITFVVRTFFIPTGSMEPTLQIHDVLLVNEFEYRFTKPHEGDIVVFTPPIASPNDFIKRVIGLPGDRIRVHGGVVYRNGVAMNEPYIEEPPNYELEVKNYGIFVDGSPLDTAFANVPPRAMWASPDRIPEGFYLMFGDHRTNSEDSHAWGFAQASGTFQTGQRKGEKASFTGHAFLLIWPPNRIRILH
jgi:signal peptidase I